MNNNMSVFGYNTLKKIMRKYAKERDYHYHRSGDSAGGDSNSWHDNFEYEDSMRQIDIYNVMLNNISKQISDAIIIQTPKSNVKIELGTLVKLSFDNIVDDEWFFLGGSGDAFVFENCISSNSILGRNLKDKKIGDEFTLKLPSKITKVKIIDIRIPDNNELEKSIVDEYKKYFMNILENV
jgi:transcription elongation GreA/GreB family factor